jgi:hypothetical protein
MAASYAKIPAMAQERRTAGDDQVDLRGSVVRDAGGDSLDHRDGMSVFILGEPLTGYFVLAALLVAAGIVLVNLRR